MDGIVRSETVGAADAGSAEAEPPAEDLSARKRVLAVGALLAATILAFDLNVELGVAAGVPTVGLILLCLWTPHQRDTWLALGVSTAIVFVGWWLSPDGGETWKVSLNRALALAAIWATGLVVLNKQVADEALLAAESARRQAEAALRDQGELARIGQMAAMIAHEVKNPLTGISGAISILGRRLGPEAEEQPILHQIQDRIGSLHESLEELLVYARPREPRRRSTPARELVGSTVGMLRADPEVEGIDIQVDVPVLNLDVDAQLIQQALVNLVLNSAHAMGSDGNIVVRARKQGSMCCVEVADDGPGIPVDLRAQVFEPFFTTRNRGTGLGLATVRRTVEQHGGHVSLHCPPQGGTVVRLVLPSAAS